MLHLMAILFFSSTVALGDIPTRPPMLDFKKQVNYIEWWNQQQGAEKDKNAFDVYQRLTIGKLNEDSKIMLSEKVEQAMNQLRLFENWTPKDQPSLAAYIDEIGPQLELPSQARTIEHSWIRIADSEEAIMNMNRLALNRVRLATKLLIYKSWRTQPNQKRAILDCCETLCHVADHWYQHGLTTDMLVGAVTQSFVYESLREALHQGLIDESDAARVYQLLMAHDRGRASWPLMAQAEWVEKLDALNYICPNGTLNQQRWGSFMGTLPFRPERARDLLDRHYERELKLLSRGLSMATLKKYEQYRDRDPLGLKRNNFTRLLIGDNRHALSLALRIEAQRRGTMTTLALLAHKHKHGQWPTGLSAIDPAMGLANLAEHRIDPISDADFKYRVKGDQISLYSIGEDDQDNGGRHDRGWGKYRPGRDLVFWPLARNDK